MKRPQVKTIALRALLSALLAIGVLGSSETHWSASAAGGHDTSASYYAGWAMDAYPGDSTAFLMSEMQHQVRAGANVVWLGHNNPGEVGGPDKHEPALSFAVWYAYRDPNANNHAQAVAMVQAQYNALDAARALGVRVVLPVGYQSQMGRAWNLAHPSAARRDAHGNLYNGPDPTNLGASFYAPDYRRDIVAYYRWVDVTFVRPYAGTVFMLNLADEPKDGDYSVWADRAFRAAHGFGLREAGADPARQLAVGRFESDYIDDYAAWSARQWLFIDPAVKVTMSFCGGYGRYIHQGPNLETIFREAPANYVVTFDAYPRDGLYDTPLQDGDLIALFMLIRTLGYYSSIYHRPLWLWSAANSWGLNEESSDPGTVADAVANGIYLAQLARQTGGDLQGIAVWNYNIKGQGLYNDTHHISYNQDTMFARVSASFALLRTIMAAPASQPDTVLLAPDEPVLRIAGAQLALRASDPYKWTVPAALARSNVAGVAVSHLAPATLPALRTVLVLARASADLTTGDRTALLTLLGQGGTVVAAAPIARALNRGAAQPVAAGITAAGAMSVQRIASSGGALFAVEGGTVEDLFGDGAARWAALLWRQVLRRPVPASGYVVAAGGVTLLYTIARAGSTVDLELQDDTAASDLLLYDANGNTVQTVRLFDRRGPLSLHVACRSYALALSML